MTVSDERRIVNALVCHHAVYVPSKAAFDAADDVMNKTATRRVQIGGATDAVRSAIHVAVESPEHPNLNKFLKRLSPR